MALDLPVPDGEPWKDRRATAADVANREGYTLGGHISCAMFQAVMLKDDHMEGERPGGSGPEKMDRVIEKLEDALLLAREALACMGGAAAATALDLQLPAHLEWAQQTSRDAVAMKIRA